VSPLQIDETGQLSSFLRRNLLLLLFLPTLLSALIVTRRNGGERQQKTHKRYTPKPDASSNVKSKSRGALQSCQNLVYSRIKEKWVSLLLHCPGTWSHWTCSPSPPTVTSSFSPPPSFASSRGLSSAGFCPFRLPRQFNSQIRLPSCLPVRSRLKLELAERQYSHERPAAIGRRAERLPMKMRDTCAWSLYATSRKRDQVNRGRVGWIYLLWAKFSGQTIFVPFIFVSLKNEI
jgi:hypothetical protein